MTDPRHVLTIELVDEDLYRGHLLLDGGTEHTTHRTDRVQILAWAQDLIARASRTDPGPPPVETLILDHAGEIVREPAEHSVRVGEAWTELDDALERAAEGERSCR